MEIALNILVAILIFGAIIFIHELGHFLAARSAGIKVNEFAIGMGPKILKKQGKNTLVTLRAFPIGGFCSMEGEESSSESNDAFCNKSAGRRFLVIVAGASMNILLGFIILVILTLSSQSLATNTVSSVDADSPIGKAGIMVDDELISVNGNKIFIANDYLTELARSNNGIATVTVKRDGETISLGEVDFKVDVDNLEKLEAGLTVYPESKTFLSVVSYSSRWGMSISSLIVNSLVDLFSGKYTIKDFTGPVGTTAIIGEAAALGWQSLLFIAAFLTINIGIFNLLPIPALDGGRLIFLIIEMIRRKPIKPEYENYVHLAGFVILIGFIVFITYNDILRIITT